MLRSLAVREEHFTFSVAPASEAQKRLALAVVLGLLVIFILLLGPLSNMQCAPRTSMHGCRIRAVNVTTRRGRFPRPT